MRATIIDAINDGLHSEMEREARTIVLGQDVGESGGVFRATDGLLDRFGSERVIDTPLSEIAIIGSAIGLAIDGFRPIAEIQFSGFLPPGFDQLVTNASRVRWRTRGAHTASMVVRTPYGAGVRALEHHSESLEAAYGHIPGLKVVIPSTPHDMKGLLISGIRDPDPVLIMEPKHIYRSIREEIPEGPYTEPIGKAAVRQEGEDITVISWGSMMHQTQEAVDNLEEIDTELIDLRSISPLDKDAILTSVRKTGRCVVVHEAAKTGGFAAEIIATINDDALLYLEAPIARVTGYDIPVPLLSMEDYYIPHPPRIEEAIKATVDF